MQDWRSRQGFGGESGTRWMPGCSAKEAVRLYPADWGDFKQATASLRALRETSLPDTLLPLYHLCFCLISELSLHGDAAAAAAQTL